MRPTVKHLREWLATLPPEFNEAEVSSIVGGYPSIAKRVIAYRWKKEGVTGITVNSMGTHYSLEWAKDVEIVSILSP